MTSSTSNDRTAASWLPVFWEPVEGSGERLMAGVVGWHGDLWQARRVLRDDVIESLYGEKADGAIKLIDRALAASLVVAERAGLEALRKPMMGLSPGTVRHTSARNFLEIMRQAALLYSSLTSQDAVEAADEAPNQRAEEGNRRFDAEVRSIVSAIRPDFRDFMNKRAPVADGGLPVKFGFLSPNLAVQFAVLHPVRQSSSMTTARSKLFELQRVKLINSVAKSALVMAVPPSDAAVFHEVQRRGMASIREEIQREAMAVDVILADVITVQQGAERVIELQAT